MNHLFDTQILVWALTNPERLSEEVSRLLEVGAPGRHFSAVAIWEIAIKTSLGRPEFRVDPALARATLLKAGFHELPVDGRHAALVRTLPPIHRDPFDRMLVAQAQIERLTLVTADAVLARYPGQIRLV